MAEQSEISQLLQHLVAQAGRHEQQIDQLVSGQQRTNAILETVVAVQNKMLDQMQLIYAEQQVVNHEQRAFNARQEAFNTRQEAFNARQEDTDAILLSELREIRSDLRELKNIVLTDHEERLRRLEDFMRRAS